MRSKSFVFALYDAHMWTVCVFCVCDSPLKGLTGAVFRFEWVRSTVFMVTAICQVRDAAIVCVMVSCGRPSSGSHRFSANGGGRAY